MVWRDTPSLSFHSLSASNTKLPSLWQQKPKVLQLQSIPGRVPSTGFSHEAGVTLTRLCQVCPCERICCAGRQIYAATYDQGPYSIAPYGWQACKSLVSYFCVFYMLAALLAAGDIIACMITQCRQNALLSKTSYNFCGSKFRGVSENCFMHYRDISKV